MVGLVVGCVFVGMGRSSFIETTGAAGWTAQPAHHHYVYSLCCVALCRAMLCFCTHVHINNTGGCIPVAGQVHPRQGPAQAY